MSKNILLISVPILKDRSGIHDNIDEKLVFPEIKTAQDLYIHPLLGTALFNKIINDIDTTGTTTGAYKTLLDDYIIDALCFYVLAALPMALSFQFWNKGVTRKIGEDTENPSMSELIDISNYYRDKAEVYSSRCRKYLQATATSIVLPEYLDAGNTLDVISPDTNSFTMPIYLGEGENKINCYFNE